MSNETQKTHSTFSLSNPRFNQAIFQITRTGVVVIFIINTLARELTYLLPFIFPMHLVFELIHACSDVEKLHAEQQKKPIKPHLRFLKLFAIISSISVVTVAIFGTLLAKALFVLAAPALFTSSFGIQAVRFTLELIDTAVQYSRDEATLQSLLIAAARAFFRVAMFICVAAAMFVPGAQMIAGACVVALVASHALMELGLFLYTQHKSAQPKAARAGTTEEVDARMVESVLRRRPTLLRDLSRTQRTEVNMDNKPEFEDRKAPVFTM